MEKGYTFYCQLDYPDYRYPDRKSGFGTIAYNGCGPCCAAMVAENMLHIDYKPWKACLLAIACGARNELPGTDFGIFTPVFAEDVGLHVKESTDPEEARQFLAEKRGMVIANTKGDRPDDGYIGVFSDCGHYITLTDLEGDKVRVLDPMYKAGSGRYDKPGRKGKVILEGNEAIADFDVIRQDCCGRYFFLFWR